MTFLWPVSFAGLALIPLLILLYAWMQRRRRRYAVRYSSLSLVRAAVQSQSRLRRYLPMGLFCLALASLVFGLARPVVTTEIPTGRATVMLVLDVSGSMNSNDIKPTRLGAARQASVGFVAKQKSTNQVGIVAFSDFAQLVQAPTTDQGKLDDALASLYTGRRTAIGDGITTALDAINQYDPNSSAQATPTAGGSSYRPDIIVLLTDGVNNSGVDPMQAAQQAADQGVRVYTIAFGTQAGAEPQGGGGSGGGFGGGPGGGGFGGGFGRGFRGFGIDVQLLQNISSLTGGKYFTASSAGELQSVFDSLPVSLITRQETVEVSVLAAALGAALMASAVLLSQLWHPLP